ncbi:DUF2147 domain-containing protein [Maribacter sp. X9]|uniref:DUF2147 domain-containing protein n=1 Tax=Maribacter sp. X9 TaxID=3402159 RepID=UPI003AF3DCB4
MDVLRTKTGIAILLLSIGISVKAQRKEDLIGYWKSCDEGDNMVVRVQMDSDNKPVGRLVGFQRDDGTWEKGKPPKGIKVMYNFKYDGNLTWNRGKIYDPLTDRTYRGVVKLQSSDTIKAIGYWVFLWDDILFKKIELNEKDEPNS